jgi:biotin-dependent carboxylase-like uncharacterized protein
MTIEILKPGLQTTVQSRPRTGLRHLGVPASGAADPLSMSLANRLVGNAWDAPLLEATLVGPTLRFDADRAFGIAGGHFDVRLNDEPLDPYETAFARAGDVLTIGGSAAGARAYIAFAGGLAIDELLGSASTYLPGKLGGFEGRALEAGDTLPMGLAQFTGAAVQTPQEFRPPMSTSWAIRVCESFESDVLTELSRERLWNTNWTIGQRADRMGMKLEGVRLETTSEGRMPSAPVFPGTIQCTEGGSPFLLSIDAGTIGGYPRVAQVIRADRHLPGQFRPGDRVRLLLRDAEQSAPDLRAKLDYWGQWLDAIDEVY